MKTKLISFITLLLLLTVALGVAPTNDNSYYVAGDEDIPVNIGR
jgi:hypothetical protein